MTEIDKDKLASDPEALHEFNRAMIAEFRANRGHVSDLPGGQLLLLHTTGARSGRPRLSPLAYFTVGNRMLIVGSSLGASKAPAWLHNLHADPRARIEVGTEAYDVVARVLPPEERDQLFMSIAEQAPVLKQYQAGTERTIPLIELTRG